MKHYRIIAIVLAAALVLTTGGCDLFTINIAESKDAATDSLSESNSESTEEETELEAEETSESEEASVSEEETESEEADEEESESESEDEEESESASDESEEESESESKTEPSTEETGVSIVQTQAPETEPVPTAPTTPPAPAVTSIDGTALVQYAMQFVGKTPYLWGGEDLVNGADCSGVIVALYRHFGISIPHYSGALTDQGSYRRVGPDEILPGDIVGATGAVELFIGYIYEDAQRMAFRMSESGSFVKASDLLDVVPVEGVVWERQLYNGTWIEEEMDKDFYVRMFSGTGYIPLNMLQKYAESWTLAAGHENDLYESYMETYTMRRGFAIGYTSETPGTKLTLLECGEASGYRLITNTAASQDAPNLFH